MEEGIFDVQLVNWPIPRMSEGEHYANSGRFDNGTERLIVVNTGMLGEATKDQSRLVSVQGAISMKFVFENPLACDDIGLGRARNKVPGVIFHESSILFPHGVTPMRVSKSVAARPGN
jgi:hypothetical protein